MVLEMKRLELWTLIIFHLWSDHTLRLSIFRASQDKVPADLHPSPNEGQLKTYTHLCRSLQTSAMWR